MRRLSALFIAVSFITASCVGNASLWGQYTTPTPVRGSVLTATPAPFVVPSDIPSDTPTLEGPFVVDVAATFTPVPTVTAVSSPTPEVAALILESTATATATAPTANPTILYYSQSGDWLPAVARRFGVDVSEITSPKVLPQTGLLDLGTLLTIRTGGMQPPNMPRRSR